MEQRILDEAIAHEREVAENHSVVLQINFCSILQIIRGCFQGGSISGDRLFDVSSTHYFTKIYSQSN